MAAGSRLASMTSPGTSGPVRVSSVTGPSISQKVRSWVKPAAARCRRLGVLPAGQPECTWSSPTSTSGGCFLVQSSSSAHPVRASSSETASGRSGWVLTQACVIGSPASRKATHHCRGVPLASRTKYSVFSVVGGSSSMARTSSAVSGQNPNAAVCSALRSANTSATCTPVAGSTVNPAGSPAGSRTDMLRVSRRRPGSATQFRQAPLGSPRPTDAVGVEVKQTHSTIVCRRRAWIARRGKS